MTTSIDDLDDLDEYINKPDSIDIFDMSIPSSDRIHIINSFSHSIILEYVNRITSMYYASSTTLLKEFIIDICRNSTISFILKIECCKCLCLKNPQDPSNYKLLHNLVKIEDNLPIPCKILAIIFHIIRKKICFLILFQI